MPRRYYKSGATVVMKRIPALPQELEGLSCTAAGQMPVPPGPDAEQLIATATYRTAHSINNMSALDSTVHSHAKQLDAIRKTDPFHRTTAQVFGARLPIEQVRGAPVREGGLLCRSVGADRWGVDSYNGVQGIHDRAEGSSME
jgi:hypothetical protein